MSSGRSRFCPGASTRPTTAATVRSKSASPPTSFARGKRSLQILDERVRIVAEHDGADALLGRGDEHAAERGLADGEADDEPFAAAAGGGRGHAEPRGRMRVEAARGIVARVVDRLGDGPGGPEPLGRAPRPHLGGIGLRRHARDLLEDAMEVERAQGRFSCEIVQRRRLLGRRDPLAGAPDRLDLRVGLAEPVGPAALAGAKAGALRLRLAREKGDVLALRRARLAARQAIDAGRLHRDEERAVIGRIAAAHGVPHGVGRERRLSGWRLRA